MKPLYLVSGCGVSAVCEIGSDGMYWFVQRIIQKGGVPVMLPYNGEELDWQGRRVA
jgi:hypothetical protein